jgi:hypothetical protein
MRVASVPKPDDGNYQFFIESLLGSDGIIADWSIEFEYGRSKEY